MAVGTFDGVHLGHRRLIDTVVAEARRIEARGGPGTGCAVAITFRRPPRAVIERAAAAPLLCPLEERLDLIRALGLDAVVAVDFADDIRLMTAAEFTSLLRRELAMEALVVGPGTSMGHDRADSRALEALGREGGFRVRVVAPVLHLGSPVRSSAIRTAVLEGRVRDAAAMLGRPFALAGPVTSGNRRGRELGFPTANLPPPPETALPADGVYAAWAVVAGARHAAAASIGVRPTFGGHAGDERVVEAFLIGFQGDLYGKTMRLEFIERLRGQERVPSASALARQMTSDTAAALRALEDTAPTLGGKPDG